MDQFKKTMMDIIKRRISDEVGNACLGCIDNSLGHTCETTVFQRIDRIRDEFNSAFFYYTVQQRDQLKEKLGKAILIELLAEELPRDIAITKANEMTFHDYIRYGGGSNRVSLTTKEPGNQ